MALSLAYLLVLYLTGMEHTEYSTEVINLLQTHLQQGLIIKKIKYSVVHFLKCFSAAGYDLKKMSWSKALFLAFWLIYVMYAQVSTINSKFRK